MSILCASLQRYIFHSFNTDQVWIVIRFQSFPEMFAPLVLDLSGSRQILSPVVKSYNYSQLVFLWVVGIKQQILINVSGFPVNFNFRATLPTEYDRVQARNCVVFCCFSPSWCEMSTSEKALKSTYLIRRFKSIARWNRFKLDSLLPYIHLQQRLIKEKTSLCRLAAHVLILVKGKKTL